MQCVTHQCLPTSNNNMTSDQSTGQTATGILSIFQQEEPSAKINVPQKIGFRVNCNTRKFIIYALKVSTIRGDQMK